jgi:hypothetical protein
MNRKYVTLPYVEQHKNYYFLLTLKNYLDLKFNLI